jgi:DNA polymerase-1
VFGVPVDQVSSEQRRYAKVINFGLIYGMGAFGLAQQPGHRQQAAKNYIERYFERYPGVKRYMDETRARPSRAMSKPCSAAACGCPRSRAPTARAAPAPSAQAINAPMQGTAADLIKLA